MYYFSVSYNPAGNEYRVHNQNNEVVAIFFNKFMAIEYVTFKNGA